MKNKKDQRTSLTTPPDPSQKKIVPQYKKTLSKLKRPFHEKKNGSINFFNISQYCALFKGQPQGPQTRG